MLCCTLCAVGAAPHSSNELGPEVHYSASSPTFLLSLGVHIHLKPGRMKEALRYYKQRTFEPCQRYHSILHFPRLGFFQSKGKSPRLCTLAATHERLATQQRCNVVHFDAVLVMVRYNAYRCRWPHACVLGYHLLRVSWCYTELAHAKRPTVTGTRKAMS